MFTTILEPGDGTRYRLSLQVLCPETDADAIERLVPGWDPDGDFIFGTINTGSRMYAICLPVRLVNDGMEIKCCAQDLWEWAGRQTGEINPWTLSCLLLASHAYINSSVGVDLTEGITDFVTRERQSKLINWTL